MRSLLEQLVDKTRRTSTIKTRLYLFLLFLLGLTYLSSLVSIYKLHTSFVHERTESLEYIVNVFLPSVATKPLRYGNKDEIENACKTLIESTYIRQIRVFDADDELFYMVSSEHLPKTFRTIKADVLAEEINATFDDIDYDTTMATSKKIRIGSIEATIDESGLQDAAIAKVLSSSIPVLMIMAISIPIAFLLGLTLTRPLKQIVREMENFEQGREIINQDKGYIDEYGRLGRALQRAAEEINRKTEDLESQIEMAIDARKVVEESAAQRETFASSIASDLKYPIGGVISGLEMLDISIFNALARLEDIGQDEISAKQKFVLLNELMSYASQVERAKENSVLIELLVNDIVSSYGIAATSLKSVKRRVNIVDAMDKLMKRHKISAEAKGLMLDYKCSEKNDVWVLTDWLDVAQIINVLTVNAIEYTASGSITCDMKVVNEENSVSVYFYVTDTGTGIVGKEREFVDLILAGKSPNTDSASTQSAGLKIAKKLSDKIGGVLALRSTSQSGSMFFFECQFEKIGANPR